MAAPIFCPHEIKAVTMRGRGMTAVCVSVRFHINTKPDEIQEQPQRITAAAVTDKLTGGSFEPPESYGIYSPRSYRQMRM